MTIMPTKTELALETSQQGVSNEVLIVIMDPVMKYTTLPSHLRVIHHSIHNDDGNPSSANIKQALRSLDNIKLLACYKTLYSLTRQMIFKSIFNLISMGSLKRASGHRKAEHELTTQSVYTKVVVPHSSGVEFIATCSYLIDEYKDMMKAQGRTVEVRDLPTIDLEELIKLRICERVLDIVSWVAEGPSRQQVGAARGGAEIDLEVSQDAPVEATESREGGAADECEPRAATCDDKGDDKRACQVESDRGPMVLVPQLSRPKPSMMHDHPDSWTFYAFASMVDIANMLYLIWNDEEWVIMGMPIVIIEQLAKDGENNVFWSRNDEAQESLLNLKNTSYHSRQIRCIPRLRRIQDHCLTLKNTPYPHQQICRI
ncbi:hypothetical protein Tco_0128962 [Tanacetum coccineum]